MELLHHGAIGAACGSENVERAQNLRAVDAHVEAALTGAGLDGFGEVEINTSKYSVSVAGAPVSFTKKEFELLVFLARRPGRVITRDTLLNEIWGDNVVVIDRTIDVHIRKIREKLGDDNMPFIETIKGVGYRLRAED